MNYICSDCLSEQDAMNRPCTVCGSLWIITKEVAAQFVVTLEHPPFEDFNIYHAGISGGKDSTDLALWLRFESGLPLEKIDMTFCDTGNEDPLTYAFLDLLREIVAPVAINVIHPDKAFWDLAYSRHSFPTRRARFCTQELKIIPTRSYILALQQNGVNVLMMNGVRQSEGHSGNDRGNAPEWEHDWDGFGAWLYRPILYHTLDQVWAMHKKYIPLERVIALVYADPAMADETKAHLATRIAERGIPDNPLYAMGARRVGCFPCINSVKLEMRAMAKYRPERIDFIELQEARVGSVNPFGHSSFFHSHTVPKQFRTRHITGVTLRSKEYKEFDVPTIRDVVEWSKTKRGGKQYDMDFDDIPASACDIGGMCE